MSENRERTEAVTVRITAAERKELEKKAKELNMNVSTLVRLLASGEVKVTVTGDKSKAE